MKKLYLYVLSLSTLLFILGPVVLAQSPQQVLSQYISDLKKSPNDFVLREKIVSHVQSMKPAPEVPEEARRHFIEGNTLIKAAKDQRGYGLARDAYQRCLLIAPWWAEAYYNSAVVLDLANQFDEAVNALKLYIASNPGEGESRKAQDKIYEIEARKKLAAKETEESSPKAVSALKQNTFEDLLRKIDGRRYIFRHNTGAVVLIDIRGKVFLMGSILPNQSYQEAGRFEITGRVSSYVPPQPQIPGWIRQVEGTYTISDDGERINQHLRYADGDVKDYILIWQR